MGDETQLQKFGRLYDEIMTQPDKADLYRRWIASAPWRNAAMDSAIFLLIGIRDGHVKDGNPY